MSFAPINFGKDFNNATETAKRRARYGHRSWIRWKAKTGEAMIAPVNYANVKLALLAIGTQGKFAMFCGDDGVQIMMRWRNGINLLSHQKLGINY